MKTFPDYFKQKDEKMLIHSRPVYDATERVYEIIFYDTIERR